MTDYTFAQIIPDASLPPRYAPGQEYTIEFQHDLDSVALANGDTITTPSGALPNEGIRITEIEVISPELDTDVSPTGTYDVGDSDDPDRFIDGALMSNAGGQLINFINRGTGTTLGVITTGPNYLYAQGSTPQLVLTVASAVATGATTGVIRFKVHYNCVGEQ